MPRTPSRNSASASGSQSRASKSIEPSSPTRSAKSSRTGAVASACTASRPSSQMDRTSCGEPPVSRARFSPVVTVPSVSPSVPSSSAPSSGSVTSRRPVSTASRQASLAYAAPSSSAGRSRCSAAAGSWASTSSPPAPTRVSGPAHRASLTARTNSGAASASRASSASEFSRTGGREGRSADIGGSPRCVLGAYGVRTRFSLPSLDAMHRMPPAASPHTARRASYPSTPGSMLSTGV